MEKLNTCLLLTFDYELFLHESGHIDKCLINPTNEILSILKRYDAKATFFVDATYLLRLKEVNINDYNIIESQLRDIVRAGSRIELHVHPHWIDSIYRVETNDFVFDNYRYYKHSNCDYNYLKDLFARSVKLLNTIAQKEIPSYKVVAFRAGGWCIDPFNELADIFKSEGLYIDSSVIPKKVCTISHQSYDYSDIDKTGPYYFENSVHKESVNGPFIEYPISIHPYSFFDKISHKIVSIFDGSAFNVFGDGKSSITPTELKRKKKLLSILRTENNMFSIDGFCFCPSRRYLAANSVLTIVGHPKALTRTSLKTMDYLCQVGKQSLTLKEYAEAGNRF